MGVKGSFEYLIISQTCVTLNLWKITLNISFNLIVDYKNEVLRKFQLCYCTIFIFDPCVWLSLWHIIMCVWEREREREIDLCTVLCSLSLTLKCHGIGSEFGSCKLTTFTWIMFPSFTSITGHWSTSLNPDVDRSWTISNYFLWIYPKT